MFVAKLIWVGHLLIKFTELVSYFGLYSFWFIDLFYSPSGYNCIIMLSIHIDDPSSLPE